MPVPIMTGSAVIAMLLGLAIWTPGAAAASDGPTGIWATGDNDGAVEIRPCGGRLCGFIHTILRVPEPGRKLLDNRNEKPELRSRPLCGLQILGRLQKQAADTWGGGWIYDPNNGKTYNVE
ncbi:MAG: DUF2147 domain-containing protein, partial [Proteobacteria bacterium]|nr:DUF2147 domain-containing protein [Pseudomonadota bacterium]